MEKKTVVEGIVVSVDDYEDHEYAVIDKHPTLDPEKEKYWMEQVEKWNYYPSFWFLKEKKVEANSIDGIASSYLGKRVRVTFEVLED